MPGRAALARVGALLLLSALTLSLFAWDGRLRPVARDLLPNLDFSQGGSGWSATPGVTLLPDLGPAVALVTRPQRTLVYLSQDVPEPRRFALLRLSAEVRWENIVARERDWQRAGIILRSFGRGEQRVRFWPYEMFLADGSGDWQRHQRVFPVSEATVKMTLFVYNAGLSGRFLARGVRLDAVAETAVAHLARHALMICWGALIASAAFAMFVRAGRWNRWLLLLLGGLILASTLAPQPGLVYLVGDSADRAFTMVDATLARLSPEPPAVVVGHPPPPAVAGEEAAAPPAAPAESAGDREGLESAAAPPLAGDLSGAPPAASGAPPPAVVSAPAPRPSPTAAVRLWLDSVLYEGRPILGLDKQSAGHLAAFALFAGLLAVSIARLGLLPLAGYLLLAAAGSEVLQSFVISRGVELADLAMNAAGIAAGLSAGWLVRRRRRLASG